MNTKNITKTGLNTFIEWKIKAQEKATQDQIRNLVDARIDPVITSMIDVKKIEELAAKFADQYAIALEKHSDVMEWNYQEVLSKVNSYAISLNKRLTEDYKRKVSDHVREPNRKPVKFKNEALNEATIALQTETKPLYEKLTNLKRLKNELENVIKNEHTGGRAYKALIALGVDMTGFEDTSSMLPAVVKLSVDVCLMNGNCNEEKSA